MKISKKALIAIVFLLLYSTSQAQIINEKTAVNAGISESDPYNPVEFQGYKEKKKKKKSKAKNVIDSTISAREDFVIIPVSALNKSGKFIRGLKRDDFKVFVDDTETEFSLIENDDEPLNVIMLFDVSPSTEERVEQKRKIAARIIAELKPEDRIQIIKFSDKLQVVSPLTNDRQITEKSFDKLKMSGGTSLYDTVYKLYTEYIPAISGRKALILFTDGVDTMSDKADFYSSLLEAEKMDMPVFPVYFNTYEDFTEQRKKSKSLVLQRGNGSVNVGFGDSKIEYDLGKFYLNELIKLSGGRAIIADKIDFAKNTDSTRIAEDLRSKYYLKIKTANSEKENLRRQIKIRVDKPDLRLFSRGSYISNPN